MEGASLHAAHRPLILTFRYLLILFDNSWGAQLQGEEWEVEFAGSADVFDNALAPKQMRPSKRKSARRALPVHVDPIPQQREGAAVEKGEINGSPGAPKGGAGGWGGGAQLPARVQGGGKEGAVATGERARRPGQGQKRGGERAGFGAVDTPSRIQEKPYNAGEERMNGGARPPPPPPPVISEVQVMSE